MVRLPYCACHCHTTTSEGAESTPKACVLMTRYGWSDPAVAARYQRPDEEREHELVARTEGRFSLT